MEFNWFCDTPLTYREYRIHISFSSHLTLMTSVFIRVNRIRYIHKSSKRWWKILYWGISHFRTNNVKWVEFFFSFFCQVLLCLIWFSFSIEQKTEADEISEKINRLISSSWDGERITHNETFVQNRNNYTSICHHTRKIIKRERTNECEFWMCIITQSKNTPFSQFVTMGVQKANAIEFYAAREWENMKFNFNILLSFNRFPFVFYVSCETQRNEISFHEF